MWHEDNLVHCQSRQHLTEKLGRMPGVKLPQVIPRVIKLHVLRRTCQPRVVRVSDGVQSLWFKPRMFETPPGGQLRKLPRCERHRSLAVLTSTEALFFSRSHDGTVDDKGSSRVMKQGVNAENPQRAPPNS